MDVSVSVSCFHDELASTVERALKAAVDTVLWEITKTVGGRFAEKEKENEKLKLRLEMSERELRAMRECLMMSGARSPPSAVSFSRTVQNYTEDGTGTCVRFREQLNDRRVAEDRAFAAEQRPVLIEEVETKENLNCDEIGERAITDTGAAGKLAYQTTRPETETELVPVKEEPNESVHSQEHRNAIETVHSREYGAEIETVHNREYGAEIETVRIKEELPELEYSCTEVPDSDHNNTRVHDEPSEPLSRPPVLDPGKSPQRRIAPGEKPHRCPDCGKRFRRLAHLRDHRRIHTGEKPFHCEDCGKRFSRLEHRKIHQRIHTGEKPYHCATCGKRFNQLSAFKTHLRIHTGEKPYRCEACGARFTYSQQLKAHRCQGPANSRENSHSARADWKTPLHYGL